MKAGIYLTGLVYILLLINASSQNISKNDIANYTTNNHIGFIENKGQMIGSDGKPVPFVLFKTELPGMNLYITEKGLTYMFLKYDEDLDHEYNNEDKPFEMGKEKKMEEEGKYEWVRMDVEIVGSNIRRENIMKENPNPTNFYYYLAHCPDGILDVKEYQKLTIKNIYEGIDFIIYHTFHQSNETEMLKYDFVLHPGADVSQIKLLYKGKGNIEKISNDELEITTPLGKLNEGKLYCYEQNSKKEVISTYQLSNISTILKEDRDSNRYLEKDYAATLVSFQLSDYDPSETIIIDPALKWSTFYGGNSIDGPMSITSDDNGNIFITGYTWSTDFPILDAGTFFQGTLAVAGDAFIMKFDTSGNRIWVTYYGGTNIEGGYSITSDNSGNIFVTGFTASNDFPVQNAGTFFQGTLDSGYQVDAFILKFTNNGIRQWATYYGGTGGDYGNSIKSDTTGNIFVTGETWSGDFPVQNAGTFFQGTGSGSGDAFILKFTNAGTRQWATYYGGMYQENYTSIDVDNNNNIILTGYTRSTNIFIPPPPAGSFIQSIYGGGYRDVLISKFDNNGNIIWSTYYGGNNDDIGSSVISDANGNIFLTGTTNSTNFPVQNAGTFFQGTLAGGSRDAFILKFSDTHNQLWATYYGGIGLEEMNTYDNITMDTCGNVYISFSTESIDLPVQISYDSGFFDNSLNVMYSDLAIVEFDNMGNRIWATYLGGDGKDFREAIEVADGNNLFITGEWSGVSNPSTYPLADPGNGAYYDGSFNGGLDDGYIVKFTSKLNPIFRLDTIPASNCMCNGSATAFVNSFCPCTINYLWSTGDSTQTIDSLCAGNYWVIMSTCSESDTMYFTIVEIITSGITTSNTGPYCTGFTIELFCIDTTAITYSWNGPNGFVSNQQNPTILNSTDGMSGQYTVTVTNASGCTATAITNVIVNANPIANATNTGPYCAETTIQLNSVGGFATDDWLGPLGYNQPNIQNPTIALSTSLMSGIYTVTITNVNDCTTSSTTSVIVTTSPIADFDFASDVSCKGATIMLNDLSIGADSIIFFLNGTPIPFGVDSIAIDWSTSYELLLWVYNDECVDSVSKNFISGQYNFTLTMPNVFTPFTSNGVNDEYCPIGLGGEYCYKMYIYNRWGIKIWESLDEKPCWDGKHKDTNAEAVDGVYYFLVEFEGGEKAGFLYLISNP